MNFSHCTYFLTKTVVVFAIYDKSCTDSDQSFCSVGFWSIQMNRHWRTIHYFEKIRCDSLRETITLVDVTPVLNR